MNPSELCPAGYEITSESDCGRASDQANLLELDPKRALVSGGYNGVPYQCSAQIGGDHAFHWNSNSNSDNSGLNSDPPMYGMICRAGMKKFLCDTHNDFCCLIKLLIFRNCL